MLDRRNRLVARRRDTMRIQDKTYKYHLIWAWISLAVNVFLMWIFLYSASNKKEHLLIAFATAIAILLQGGIMVWSRAKSEYTPFVAVSDYICAGILSLLFAFYSYKHTGVFAIIITTVAAMIIESAIAVIISYRFRIFNWLKKLGAEHHRRP